ncbi:hypothetical protein EYC84_005275 [Monilinia fructicola]|uniref:Uncharacterized protein n=1 Tax=Monilinia fructicola TaxID=38448 RepID=A0A5M9JVZ8_MONFR|nr:hypothetical protein EYC84_005275 [Monilinia fructicola]
MKKSHTSYLTEFQPSGLRHSDVLQLGTRNLLPDMNRANLKRYRLYSGITSKFGTSALSQNRTVFHQFKSYVPSDSYVCRVDLKKNDKEGAQVSLFLYLGNDSSELSIL